jgi:hypothetical protein
MSRTTIEHDSLAYTVSPDDPVPDALRHQALLVLRLVDEITGEGVSEGIALETAESRLRPRVSADGIAGLAGVPIEAFPDLAASPYEIDFGIRSDAYVPEARRETIAAQPGFPLTFDPLEIGDVPLHTRAVTIEGRVVEDDGVTRTPVAGAAVEITELWRTPPTMLVDPVEPPNLVAIAAPLYARRGSLLGDVRQREMTPVGAAMRVIEIAAAGQLQMRTADSVGLNAGDIVEIEYDDPALPQHDPARTEYVLVEAVDRLDPSLPTTLTLVHDLAFRHGVNTFVRRVTPQAPGPAVPLARRALAGEECLFLTNLAGLLGAEVVEIRGDVDLDGLPLEPEYHRVFTFATVTDADGFYRLPPLSRAAQVTIQTVVGPDTPRRAFNPDYSQPVNRCDLIRPF